MQYNNIFNGNNGRKYYNHSINLTFLKKGLVNNNVINMNNINTIHNDNSENYKKIIKNDIENKETNMENSRLRWGPSTWYLFHTIAEKIKESDFFKLKQEILDNIKSICMNLPCPTCREHASVYIQKLNYNSIKNKEDLKRFLFNFHNDVNIRKNTPIFSYEELNQKYSKANTINVIKNFIEIFQHKNKGFNMIANEMQKQRQVERLKIWFNNNIQSFEI
jgi:hypothetical protein